MPAQNVYNAVGCTAFIGEKLTEDCKKELANFKIYHATNINKNITLGAPSHLFIPPLKLSDLPHQSCGPTAMAPVQLGPAKQMPRNHQICTFSPVRSCRQPAMASVQLRRARQMPRQSAQTLILQTLEQCLNAYGARPRGLGGSGARKLSPQSMMRTGGLPLPSTGLLVLLKGSP